MILAFLRAELGSPRWGPSLTAHLDDIDLVVEPDLTTTVYVRGRDPHGSVEVIAGYAADMQRWSWF